MIFNENQNNMISTNNSANNALETMPATTELTVVGLGASAGGLEPILLFLENVPETSGLAFIIVQHMEKDNKGILAELLHSATTMPVTQVIENTPVKPDCVYIIPPNKNMSIEQNILHIFDHKEHDNQSLPIDYFFHALANDQGEKSIGVILSGMGTDGTLGLSEIKAKGGGVFVQEPSSAKFDSMPRSVIEAGLADVISTAETLPSKIISYIKDKQQIGRADGAQEDKVDVYVDNIIDLVRAHTSHDFSLYKNNTIQRRIERRMGVYNFTNISEYITFLKQNPNELELLFKEFLIGVTAFFRDPKEWELLSDKVIPALLADRSPTDTVRVWVSGCSTGEEAYSFAIAFNDVVCRLNKNFSIQIFATDLDNDAIDKAREGIFSDKIAKDMSAERLNQYFVKIDQGYQIDKAIRDMVIFAQQNMIKDPPFTKLDILSCRNLLIYMKPEIQKKLMPLFHYSLNSDGFLFLGSAESVGDFTDLFKTLDLKSRIYQRLISTVRMSPIVFPTSFARAQTQKKQTAADVVNLQSLVDKVLLQYYSPTSVLVNSKGDILYITGRTGKYLEPSSGKVNFNIFSMAREGLKTKIADAFFKACRSNKTITLKSVVVINEGGPLMVDITVNPLKEPDALCGMVMITFNDVVSPITNKTIDTTGQILCDNPRADELERELLQTRQMWQITSSEMQITQEDFKSSNEELQSCNEELQSANEELTTTKEEIQSSNEELKKINAELQAKLNDLSLVTNDIKNLMNSTKIAILFLDNEVLIKHFTNEMTKIFRLIQSDVGRPITDIACDLIYPELASDIGNVQQTQVGIEKQVISSNGNWYNVRVLPYMTIDGKIDGVVITFVNIT